MSSRSTRSLVTLAAVAVLALGGGTPAAFARHGADDPIGHDAGDDNGGTRVLASHGADDPAGHDANDDKGGKRKAARRAKHHRHGKHHRAARAARHGADDPTGDDNGGRRGRGNDDGPNHT